MLSVAENFRRDPIQRLGKALLDDGAIGTPRVMLQTMLGGRDTISMTPWRHMKATASMPVDAGVHEADLLRFYLGEFERVFGESRLHETTRRKRHVDRAGRLLRRLPGDHAGHDHARRRRRHLRAHQLPERRDRALDRRSRRARPAARRTGHLRLARIASR